MPEACKAIGLKRPLLVTDPGLARLPMIADATTSLRRAGLDVGLFSDLRPNPVASNVEAGLRADRLRHDFAKPAQQYARTTEGATHDVISRALHPAGAGWPRQIRK